jgi:anti-sigma regulatory factor (Ser/Thr protein kinase)
MSALALEAAERKDAEARTEAARQRTLTVEVEKKRFTREVLRVVTDGKLQLLEQTEIPSGGTLIGEFVLTERESYPELRRRLRELGREIGMPAEEVAGLVLAAGEAVTNALKHAEQGRAVVFLEHDRIMVRVSDAGPGIHPEHLPATVLQPGFSTKVSLGMGYTLMLGLCDRMWHRGANCKVDQSRGATSGPDVGSSGAVLLLRLSDEWSAIGSHAPPLPLFRHGGNAVPFPPPSALASRIRRSAGRVQPILPWM